MATQRRRLFFGELAATGVALAAASVSPLAFDWSAGSAMSLHDLGEVTILPALGVWILVIAVAAGVGWQRRVTAGLLAVLAGVLATAALEFVRIIGFRLFDTMPGSMPMLMGVQFTDRFTSNHRLRDAFGIRLGPVENMQVCHQAADEARSQQG